MRRPTRSTPHHSNDGIVLPIALIMLVIISFAGLLAARNSATYEQFTSNMRTNQVARISAEDALRYCERVAIDSVENEGANFATDAPKIVATVIADDDVATIQGAEWNKKSNWLDTNNNLIEVTQTYGDKVVTDEDAPNSKLKNPPTCIIQAMVNDRFLITSRGLSSDATVDEDDGTLVTGSEVWLQSILTQKVPVYCVDTGGVCN